MKQLLSVAAIILCFLTSKQTLAQQSVITTFPDDFTNASLSRPQWEILNNFSVFLFSETSNGNKIWIQNVGGPVVYFLRASDMKPYSYKTSDENAQNTVLNIADEGPSIICNFSSCNKDTLPLQFDIKHSWMHYFDKNNDLRGVWNAENYAYSYSYYFRSINTLNQKLDWLNISSSNQQIISQQDTLVLTTGVSGDFKNQIVDLNTGLVTTEITSPQSIPIKLNGNGRLWYAYASDISYFKWGGVRAGLTSSNVEFDLKGFESQIDQTMKSKSNDWLDGRILIVTAIESSSQEKSLVLRFNQRGGQFQSLAVCSIESKRATVLLDENGLLAKVTDVLKVDRQSNRLYAQTGKNVISIWDLNTGIFVKKVTSTLVNVDDIRVRYDALYLVDFKAGKLERLTSVF